MLHILISNTLSEEFTAADASEQAFLSLDIIRRSQMNWNMNEQKKSVDVTCGSNCNAFINACWLSSGFAISEIKQ